ncbi:MAG: hypothetical protein K0R76_1101 [Alphaproteobacteria bacterium]|nr:hypothetical protein [Alphaproteobacteria bacterium]MDF3034147.1 hypothetical protein [Alphaproteobacteria bacterium]
MNSLKKLSLSVVAMAGSLSLLPAVFAADTGGEKEGGGYAPFLWQLEIGADPSQAEPNFESTPAHIVGNLNYREGVMSLLGQGGAECDWERAKVYFEGVCMDNRLSPLLRHNTGMFMEMIKEFEADKKKGRTIWLTAFFAPYGKIINYQAFVSPPGFGDGSLRFYLEKAK